MEVGNKMPLIDLSSPMVTLAMSRKRGQKPCYNRPPKDEIWRSRGGGRSSSEFGFLADARNALGRELIEDLKDPQFSGASLDISRKLRWCELLDHGGTRWRDFYPDKDILVRHQLTADVVKAETKDDLVALYREKIGPFVIRVWEDAYAKAEKLTAGARRTGLLPPGLCTNTFQGELNWWILLEHIAADSRYMGLQFDEASRTIDPRLKPENHDSFLRAQLGLSAKASLPSHPWRQVMRKYLIGGGFKVFCGESILQVLNGHVPWIFDYNDLAGRPEGKHSHRTDFLEKNRWQNVTPASAQEPPSDAWLEADHIISEHLGIKVYDWVRDEVCPDLFPPKLEALLERLTKILEAQGKRWKDTRRIELTMRLSDVLRQAGLYQLIDRPGIKGHAGKLLALMYPPVFVPSPTRKEHLRTFWYRDRNIFSSPKEARAAVWYEIEFEGIEERVVPRTCDKNWFERVYLGFLLTSSSTLVFFKKHFPEKFEQGIWQERDFA